MTPIQFSMASLHKRERGPEGVYWYRNERGGPETERDNQFRVKMELEGWVGKRLLLACKNYIVYFWEIHNSSGRELLNLHRERERERTMGA